MEHKNISLTWFTQIILHLVQVVDITICITLPRVWRGGRTRCDSCPFDWMTNIIREIKNLGDKTLP